MQPMMGWPLEQTADCQNRSYTLNLKKGHIRQVDQNSGMRITSQKTWGVMNVPLDNWQYLTKSFFKKWR